jgi:hypothetical protein
MATHLLKIEISEGIHYKTPRDVGLEDQVRKISTKSYMFRPVRRSEQMVYRQKRLACKRQTTGFSVPAFVWIPSGAHNSGYGDSSPEVPELPSARGYSWATLSPGIIYTETWSYRLGVGRGTNNPTP